VRARALGALVVEAGRSRRGILSALGVAIWGLVRCRCLLVEPESRSVGKMLGASRLRC